MLYLQRPDLNISFNLGMQVKLITLNLIMVLSMVLRRVESGNHQMLVPSGVSTAEEIILFPGTIFITYKTYLKLPYFLHDSC